MMLLLLSDPILLAIFHHLSTELYALSLLSRRLHHLALPLFLSQLGVPDPSGSPDVSLSPVVRQLDALSALRIAIFLPSIAHLTCHFPPGNLSVSFWNLTRVRKLSEKLSSLGEVELRLNVYAGHVEYGEERKLWADEFACLCDTLGLRKCWRLVVIYLEHNQRVYTRTLKKKDTTSKNRGVFRLLDVVPSPIRGRGKITTHPPSEQPQTHLALTSLSAGSPDLFRTTNKKPFALSFSTLQSLTIKCNYTYGGEWASILPVIASTAGATLTSLSIHAQYIHPADMFKFLSSLPHLATLALSPVMHLYPRDDRLRAQLPALTSISASPDFIFHLLAPPCRPNLRSLDILLQNATQNGLLGPLGSTAVLSEILKSFQCCKHPRPTLMITVHVHAIYERHTTADVILASMLDSLLVGRHPDHKSSFALMENLTLVDVFPAGSDLDSLTLILPQWLASFFPTLVHLIFLESVDRYDKENRWGLLQPVLRAIFARCSTIQSIILDKECHDASSFSTTGVLSPTSSQYLTFLDLPEDVLSLIFEYLSPVDIYTVSMLSQHLHLLALPIYLSRRNITDPSGRLSLTLGSVNAHASLMDLSALHLSSSITSVRSLCIFIFQNTSLFVALEYLQQLRRLITRLSTVETVTITLHTTSKPFAADDEVQGRWAEALCALLDEILGKPFISLAIHDCRWFARKLDIGMSSQISRILPEQTTSHPNTQYLFTIHTDILLHDPFLPWTLSTLRKFPITQLHLTQVSNDSAPILPRIAEFVSAVTHLHLCGQPFLDAAHALEFINKLPLLESLSLGPHIASKNRANDYCGPSLQLQRLKELKAEAANIKFLLASPDSLPALQNVILYSSFMDSTAMDMDTLSLADEQLRKYDRVPYLHLDIVVNNNHVWVDDIVPDGVIQCKGRFETVKSLMVQVEVYGSSFEPPGVAFLSWLGLFPGLLRLSVNGPVPLGHDTPIVAMLREATKECRSLQTLRVGEDDYPPLSLM